MPIFEVSIPQAPKIPTLVRFQLEAENWLEALTLSYKKTIEAIQSHPNMLCDINEDNSVHVTDTGTGKVFCIIELPATEPSKTPSETQSSQPTGSQSTINQSTPISPKALIGRFGRVTSEPNTDLLEEIFQCIQDVNYQPDREKALYFILDLAINKIGTDVGSIFLRKSDTGKLFPSAARGPKVNDVMKHRIAAGFGLASFSLAEGIGLALSDVAQSTVFHKTISDKVGYLIRSILWVPIHSDGVAIGTLELINKKKTDMFSENDLNSARFIADQLGEYLLRHGE
jgi:hypothetical protein